VGVVLCGTRKERLYVGVVRHEDGERICGCPHSSLQRMATEGS
jgi:hypothetical protein